MKKFILSLIMALALIFQGTVSLAEDLFYITNENNIIAKTDKSVIVLSFYDDSNRLCGARIVKEGTKGAEISMPDNSVSVRVWDMENGSYITPVLSPYVPTPTPTVAPTPVPTPRPNTGTSGGSGGGGTVTKPAATPKAEQDTEVTPEPTPEPTPEVAERPKVAATNGIEKVKIHEGCYALVIDCRNAITNDDSTQDIWENLPPNGIMSRAVQYELEEGMTVYDALMLAASDNDLEVVGDSNYVKAIGGIGEYYNVKLNPNATYKFVNKQSGWMYRVNGEVPMVPVGGYKLQDGDRVEIIYTCAYGDDLAEYVEW